MQKDLPQRKARGFTLIELLVALTIVAILAVSVYVALNPAQRLEDAKDARRAADVDTIITAIHQSIVDNKGTIPTNMPAAGTAQQLGLGAANATWCPGTSLGVCNATSMGVAMTVNCVNLMAGTQNLTAYLASMPIDPVAGTIADANKTQYAVKRDANNIFTVYACQTDGTNIISVSR